MYCKVVKNRFSSSLNSSRGRGNKKLGISILERVASHDKSISSLRIKNTANSRGSLRSVRGMSASEYLRFLHISRYFPNDRTFARQNGTDHGTNCGKRCSRLRIRREISKPLKRQREPKPCSEQWADLWKSRGGFEPVILTCRFFLFSFIRDRIWHMTPPGLKSILSSNSSFF